MLTGTLPLQLVRRSFSLLAIIPATRIHRFCPLPEPVARNLDLRIARNIRVEQTCAHHGEDHRVFAANKASRPPGDGDKRTDLS